MDAFVYFFSNLVLLNLILSLVAFFLGLLLGRYIWLKYKKEVSNLERESQLKQSRIDELEKTQQLMVQSQSSDREGRLEEAAAKLAEMQTRYEHCFSRKNELAAQVTRLQGEQKTASLDRDGEISALQAEIAELKSQHAACELRKAALEEEVTTLKDECARSEGESDELRAKNMAFFATELESGQMKADESLGILYTSAPDEVDDLTRIKGVAGVLSKKLNDYGVYKYRQIALWTPQICEDFSNTLSFKGRIQRDNWIDQAKTFHLSLIHI